MSSVRSPRDTHSLTTRLSPPEYSSFRQQPNFLAWSDPRTPHHGIGITGVPALTLHDILRLSVGSHRYTCIVYTRVVRPAYVILLCHTVSVLLRISQISLFLSYSGNFQKIDIDKIVFSLTIYSDF